MDNPYQSIVEIMKSAEGSAPKAYFRICRVLALSPLTLDVAGTKQSGNIRCNASLLSGERRKLKESTGINGVERVYDVETVSPVLSVGDEVFVITSDDQEFFIMCKAVKA